MEVVNAVGKRKTAVARVYLKKGSGSIQVNRREVGDYFPIGELVSLIKQPFFKTDLVDQYDLKINVYGGGLRGQAEAVRLGISKALCQVSENSRLVLKKAGLLTRDARVVERKKYGRKKSRKKFQFTKR